MILSLILLLLGVATPLNSNSPDVVGAEFISTGFNLDSDGTCGLDQPSDLPGMDPLLGPLQDNGGSTDTHLPAVGSPATAARHLGAISAA